MEMSWLNKFLPVLVSFILWIPLFQHQTSKVDNAILFHNIITWAGFQQILIAAPVQACYMWRCFVVSTCLLLYAHGISGTDPAIP
jgi:hypothetical protein